MCSSTKRVWHYAHRATLAIQTMAVRLVTVTAVTHESMAEPWIPEIDEVGEDKTPYMRLVAISPGLKRLCGQKLNQSPLGSAPMFAELRDARNAACEHVALSIKGRANDPFAQDPKVRRKMVSSLHRAETPAAVFMTLHDHPSGGIRALFTDLARACVTIEFTCENMQYVYDRLMRELAEGYPRPARNLKRLVTPDDPDSGQRVHEDEKRCVFYWYINVNNKRITQSFPYDSNDDTEVMAASRLAALEEAKAAWAEAKSGRTAQPEGGCTVEGDGDDVD